MAWVAPLSSRPYFVSSLAILDSFRTFIFFSSSSCACMACSLMSLVFSSSSWFFWVMLFSILLASSRRPFMVSVDDAASCVSSFAGCSSFFGLSSFLAALVIGRDHPFPSPPLAFLSPAASFGLVHAGAKWSIPPQFQHRFLSSRTCCHAHSLPFLHPSSVRKNLQGALTPFPDFPSPFPSSIFFIFTSGCAVFGVSLLVLFLLLSKCAICSISARR